MLGFLNLSIIGILFLGALIGFGLEAIKEKETWLKKYLISWPYSFGVGLIIAWLLDDFNTTITSQDLISAVTLLITIFYVIYAYLKERSKDISNLRDKVNQLDGKVDTILAVMNIKRKKN